jgi:hypothetical protein
MKWIGLVSAILLLLGQAAAAGPTWNGLSLATTPQNAAQVVAATDKLMNSPLGKQFPGRLLLQVHMADGINPATHTFAPLYKSAADREVWVQKLMGDPTWAEYQATMAKIAQPAGQSMYLTLKSWGEFADDDQVWMSYSMAVSDPAAFLAALDKFMNSETGKKFPGQVHLSAVLAAGMTPATHVISVAYASEAEMETWGDVAMASADWAAYLRAIGGISERLGVMMSRNVKSWGALSAKDLAVP